MEANKSLNEKEENMGKTKQREGTLVENLERTLSKHRELLTVNSKLAALNDPTNTTRDKKSNVEKLETAAREAMGSKRKPKSLPGRLSKTRAKAKPGLLTISLKKYLTTRPSQHPRISQACWRPFWKELGQRKPFKNYQMMMMMINDIFLKAETRSDKSLRVVTATSFSQKLTPCDSERTSS